MSIIEGAVELIGEMWHKIDTKEVELSAEEWFELDNNLDVARNLLNAGAQLKDVATLVVNAFEQHSHLKTKFADQLQYLIGGTELTSIKPSMPTRRRDIQHNKKVILDFSKQVEEEAKKNSQARDKTRGTSWWRRSR